jgi:hypothetical protein
VSPTIQLIQLTVRIEREVEGQRRPSTAYEMTLPTKSGLPTQAGQSYQAHLQSASHRQRCECA